MIKNAQQIVFALIMTAVLSLSLLALLWTCFPQTFATYVLGIGTSAMTGDSQIVNFSEEYPNSYVFIVCTTFIFIAFFSLGTLKVLRQMYAKAKSDTYFILQEANMRSANAIQSADGKIIRSTTELAEILNTVDPESIDEANRLRSEMYVNGVHSAELSLAIKSSFKTDEKVQTLGFDTNVENTYSWWRIVILTETNKEGKQEMLGYILNIDDIKQRELNLRLSERLAEESKRKEDFLMNVSHEIRTPLNAIMGFCDFLSMIEYDEISEEEHKEISTAINENLVALSKIVNDIILFSKIENKHIHYHMEEFDIADYMIQLFEKTRAHVPERNIQLQHGRNRITIIADKNRIGDIMEQYISNALKFTNNDSQIRIGWEYHLGTKEVEIFVEDDGIGIPIEKQNAAFGIFWKDSEFVPGIGIGLNIVRRLTEGMKGRVRVDSREGVGCRFSAFFKRHSITPYGNTEPIE